MDKAWYELEWIYEWVMAVVAVIGLCLLWWYAKSTAKMAKATERQGEISSYPAISVDLCTAEDKQGYVHFSHVGTRISNHSIVHANIKLTLEAHIEKAGADKPRVFKALYPYNGDVWPFSARRHFDGHFTFEKLVNTQLATDEELWLIGRLESSPYDVIEYRPAPPIRYKWKASDQKWIPYPPELPSK